jgi:LacI family transcriptional regulator
MKMVRQRATLKMVASEAGLGLSTVGLILNGRGDELGIPKKTQKRAIEVSRRLGYRPNSLALGLVGKRTQTIGLLLPSDMYYPQYLVPQVLSLRLYRKGFQAYLMDSLQDHDVILDALAEMASRRVDGVVFSTPNHMLTPEIRQSLSRFPVTILMSHEPLTRETLRAHVIWENILSGVNEMMDHFIEAGRRRPLMVVSLGTSNQYKIAAFKNALSRHGLDSSDAAAVFGIPSITPGDVDIYSHFSHSFESQKLDARDFDALFCTCDEGAAAAANYLKKCGRRVPEDVAVVGLNNSPWVQAVQPPLASVSWRYLDSCDLVVNRLSERLKTPDKEPECDELATRFVWRESAG